MKIEQVDNHIERLIVTGMVVSGQFLQDVQTIYRPGLLEIPYARTVAGWCTEYWKQFKKAPGIHIQDIYKSKVRNGLDEDQAALIADFLEDISKEHERATRFNAEYLLAQAEERFKTINQRQLAEDIVATLSNGGTPSEVDALLAGYKRVERPQSGGVEPLVDQDVIYDAFVSAEQDILYTRPGALGEFIGPGERSTLTAYMAPSKRGKTWWLMQDGLWAVMSRCNVAFFEVGDMNQRQLVRRIHSDIARANSRFGGDIKVPVLDCRLNQENICRRKERTCNFGVVSGERRTPFEDAPDYVPCKACKKERDSEWEGAYWHRIEKMNRLTWDKAAEFGKKFRKRGGKARLMLSVHPARSINVQGIKTQLDIWERFNQFVPDVIIIDYADILAPEDKRQEFRHQQNETWMALRALSQERYCAVITATQADAASYTKKSLREENFSEDKRKYDHATMFLTLNQTMEEKKEGVMRIGKMMVREEDYNTAEQCTVLQCLDIARPYLGSYMKKRFKPK